MGNERAIWQTNIEFKTFLTMASSNLYPVLLRDKKINTFGEELEERCTIIGEKLEKRGFFQNKANFCTCALSALNS